MSAEKYLNRIEHKEIGDPFKYSRKEMIYFAEKYAEQLPIQSVVRQSERLINFLITVREQATTNKVFEEAGDLLKELEKIR